MIVCPDILRGKTIIVKIARIVFPRSMSGLNLNPNRKEKDHQENEMGNSWFSLVLKYPKNMRDCKVPIRIVGEIADCFYTRIIEICVNPLSMFSYQFFSTAIVYKDGKYGLKRQCCIL